MALSLTGDFFHRARRTVAVRKIFANQKKACPELLAGGMIRSGNGKTLEDRHNLRQKRRWKESNSVARNADLQLRNIPPVSWPKFPARPSGTNTC
jgi:hypothetical protein